MKKKFITKSLSCVLSLAMLTSLTSIPSFSQAKAKKASLANKKLSITIGKKKNISIKNKKSGAVYKFKTTSKKISISKKGKVTAKKVGTATVKVTENYKKKTRKLGNVKITITKSPSNTTPVSKATSTPKTEPTTAPTSTPGTTTAPTNKPDSTAVPSSAPTEGTEATTTPTSTAVATTEPTATANATTIPTESVVYNNFFEDGETKGFIARSASLEISDANNHTDGGMNSLLVTGRTSTWNGAQMDISKLTATGETYKFSAWVKQDTGSTEKISMKLQYTDLDGNTHYTSIVTGGDSGIDCESGKWIELAGEFKIPDYSGSLTYYFEVSSSTTADFLIDDVEISGMPVESNSFQITDELYDTMKDNSIYSTGNNARIKNVISKAQNGDDVTLAYIGGSITEGALASPNSNCYASVSAKAFATKYGKDDGSNVHFVNAGMSGTPSSLGVVRYNRDVIGQMTTGDHPDILFIEFAVNDYGEVTNGGAYEGLIRQALKSGSAVVLIFSVFQSAAGGRVNENTYRPYGEYYQLPMISMGNAIMSHFNDDGFYDWYFGDTLHPNNTGYKLMSDCIMNLFDQMNTSDTQEDNISDIDSMPAKKTDAYQGIKMIDSTTTVDSDEAISSIDAGSFTEKDTATGNFQYEYKGEKKAAWFPDNWMRTADSGSDSLKFSVHCKTLMLVYKQSSLTTFGSADIYVDGVKKTPLSCYNASGWNNGAVYVGFTNAEKADHTIEIKMADGSENKSFTLLGIGYN